MACVFLLAACGARGEDTPKSSPVPDSVCAKLKTLFQKYYPKAYFTNQLVNGICFEYEVATFDFSPSATNSVTQKHENPIQRGPKNGGILCSIFQDRGKYQGQLIMWPAGNGQVEPHIMDRKIYKQILMAPYSPKRDAHLWVSLSYPPDASEDFLKKFDAIMKDYENGTD